MPNSIYDPTVQAAIVQARSDQPTGTLFPSPADWRDKWIYFLMMDRFNNPAAPPNHLPYNASFKSYQGGTYQGVIDKLAYIQGLGAGAIWLSPVIKNCPFDTTFHGYGIQNFLAAEPKFATDPANADNELRALVDAAHELGLYVIFDIVLHHVGNVFAYPTPNGTGGTTENDSIDFESTPQGIHWRDALGVPNPAWSVLPAALPLDAAVWPKEIQDNSAFTRQGMANTTTGENPQADFFSLKAVASHLSQNGAVRDTLIRAYQYLIARFDVDSFRIDTLKFITPDFERVFGNAMREFALSAGKKNFFTFGEIADPSDTTIDKFIGRNTASVDAPVGVDAALDFPLNNVLPSAVKGLGARPLDLAQMYETRKAVESTILTSHGEAGKYFVTFLDNHDQMPRFGFTGPIQLTDQIILGIACLLTLQGVPCLYYGTEQGLTGTIPNGNPSDDSLVREALWGRTDVAGLPNGFDTTNPLYVAIQQIASVRADQPALRYGRQYFRPIAGAGGTTFGISPFSPGVIAFSRILNDQEVVIVANAGAVAFQGQVLVDVNLSPAGARYRVLYSSQAAPALPGAVVSTGPNVTIQNIDGTVSSGPVNVLPLTLAAREVQILAQ